MVSSTVQFSLNCHRISESNKLFVNMLKSLLIKNKKEWGRKSDDLREKKNMNGLNEGINVNE